MHLKEVRMVNFKSFGEHLTVPFKPGFTAITGPNGAGKSNIGDAILFVLGPRSTRLIRAKTLPELIFNGGKSGKPAKECEVTLVFENKDRLLPVEADEVALTRRIRKAPKRGDPNNYHSYCYINERAAQIGEFVDLLKHARISADGYNIVTQGSVNSLVTMTDVERRGVLEQIAGITDFDRDIDAAEKRRSEVEENLKRVEIILGEIRRALSDLKKERDGAEKHATLTRTQAGLKALFVYRKKDELERQVAETNNVIQRHDEEKEKYTKQLEELRQKHKSVLTELHGAEEKLGEFSGPEGEKTKQQIKDLQAEAVRLEERINYAQDEDKELGKSRDALATELKQVEKELKDLDATRTRLTTESETKGAALKKADKELKDLRELIAESSEGAMRIHAELAKLKVEYEETTAEAHKATLEKDRLSERLTAARELLATLEENLKTYEFEVKDSEFQLKELGKDTKVQTRTVQDLEKLHAGLLRKQTETTKELTALEDAVRKLQRDYHELKAMEEASERVGGGLNRAVDAVLEARRKGTLKGIHGTIAELGKVDPEFETALQVAAGPRLMSLVVEDDVAAATAIEHLRQHNLGRAAFLPLNKMIPTHPRGKALMVVKDGASKGFALDLVKFNKKYENAFSYVFGDTVVMNDLEAARKQMGGVRLVTLKGDLIEAAGAMIGGSMSKRDQIKFVGKDVSKLADLEGQIAEATRKMDALAQTLVDVRKEMAAAETQLSEARANEVGDVRQKDLGARRDDFQAKIEKTKKDLEERNAEREGLEDSVAKLDQKIAAGTARVQELESKREATGKLLLKGTKKEIADKATALTRDAETLKTQALEAASGAQTAAKAHELVLGKATELRTRLAAIAKELAGHEGEVKEHKAALAQIEAKLDVLTKAESQVSGKSKQLYERKEKLAVQLKDLEGKMDNLATKISTTESLIFQNKNRLPAIEEELGNILVEIKTNNLPEPKADEARSFDEARKELAEVERAIAALGPVNQRALEMFDEQAKREGELLQEVERLNQQRENLLKVVEEIVAKKKEGLMKVFDAVSENFKNVYRQLTDGGEAYLELENPERPFEGGLIMKAQPKGKKVLRLQALSGGEKSMTALGLIFAIQEYEPSPFYLLDEVDQNLDGVNAELAARRVKGSSASAQFIMVSLRKVTLKEADHIYGVTMAQNTLSQMVANFDINLVNEKGELVAAGAGGAATVQVPVQKVGGDGASPAKAPGAKKSRGIKETVQDMMRVEVDK